MASSSSYGIIPAPATRAEDAASALQEDPDLAKFRAELLKKRREQTEALAFSPKASPLRRQPRLYVRLVGAAFAVVSFTSASVAADLPAGAFLWYDFLVVSTVLAMVLDMLFMLTYVMEREGFEWCFDPLRRSMPRSEFVMTGLWTLLLCVGSASFAANLAQLTDVVEDPELKLPRVAAAFAFFASFAWMLSTWLSFRRWRAGRALPPTRYSVLNTQENL